MAMANLDAWVPQLAAEWGNSKHEKTNETTWAIDVPFKMNDGSYRYQWCYITFAVGVAKGRNIFDIRSKVADFNPGLNLKGMMIDMKHGFYSGVVIREGTSTGNPVEMIYVQAGPLCDHVNTYDEFKSVVLEVATNADILEEKYVGGDKN